MKVKIDTKEKFHVLSVEEPVLSANMTEEFKQMLLSPLKYSIKNVVLKLKAVKEIDKDIAAIILETQQIFADNHASFVVCEIQKKVEQLLKQMQFLDLLNITPTENEAWDIVQMEEIEREFLD